MRVDGTSAPKLGGLYGPIYLRPLGVPVPPLKPLVHTMVHTTRSTRDRHVYPEALRGPEVPLRPGLEATPRPAWLHHQRPRCLVGWVSGRCLGQLGWRPKGPLWLEIWTTNHLKIGSSFSWPYEYQRFSWLVMSGLLLSGPKGPPNQGEFCPKD